jgi:Mrp family chromosome partitioning ATPase
MTLRVLTALDHRHEDSIATALSADREVEVVRRCPDLGDLLAAAAAGLGDVAVVSGTVRGLDRDAVTQLDEARVRVVGVVDADETAERRLRQLGIADLVSAGAAAELVATLHRLSRPVAVPAEAAVLAVDIDAELAALEAGLDPVVTGADPGEGEVIDDDEHHAHVIAVWGPAGSPGRTTVAVNLAAEMAARGTPCLLVDADTYGACIAQVLGLLDEAPGLAAAARAAELGTLDLPTLARLTPSVATGFRVLTGLPTSSRWSEVRAASMTHILQVARRLVEVVVVDCGFCLDDDEELSYDTRAPRRNGATLAALAEADDVVAVAAADPVGLQRLVRALHDLGGVDAPVPRIVVNRLRAGAVGPGPERRVGEALARFAGVEVTAYVPEDRATLDRALLAGRVLAEEAPGSVVRERIRQLAQALLPAESASTEPRRRRWSPRSVTMGRWSTA